MGSDPADFKVDLTNCDREPIHILGNIQPFGFLVTVGPNWVINRVSANIGEFVGRPAEELLGEPLEDLFTQGGDPQPPQPAWRCCAGPDAVERLLRADACSRTDRRFDIAFALLGRFHRDRGGACLRRSQATRRACVRTLMSRLSQTDIPGRLPARGARQVRAITGFDRVMVYRFDHEGSGEVVAESLKTRRRQLPGPPLSGLRHSGPGAQLYLRNVFRIIADVNATPVPIIPQLDENGQALDQSLSILRAVSPIHIEYLRNMGVSASLSISIVVDGRLWGLFACHHYEPRLPSLAMRTAAELFGQMFSLMLESRERAETAEYEARARAATDRMMAAVAQDGDLLAESRMAGRGVCSTRSRPTASRSTSAARLSTAWADAHADAVPRASSRCSTPPRAARSSRRTRSRPLLPAGAPTMRTSPPG